MTNENPDNPKYQVISVEKTTPPSGLPGDNWYRYVIGQGRSKIDGLKRGSLQAVTQHAESVVDDMNERNNRGGSTYTARRPNK
ncbi:MAG: hypothetical protein OQK73_11915 [Gammaproteobacteria bacterium]|nr:hypothetical protein [Gammaproteobacteria bacterium]